MLTFSTCEFLSNKLNSNSANLANLTAQAKVKLGKLTWIDNIYYFGIITLNAKLWLKKITHYGQIFIPLKMKSSHYIHKNCIRYVCWTQMVYHSIRIKLTELVEMSDRIFVPANIFDISHCLIDFFRTICLL